MLLTEGLGLRSATQGRRAGRIGFTALLAFAAAAIAAPASAQRVTSVAVGSYHTVFAKADGSMWAMGRNDAGQLGDGTTTDRRTPVQVASGVVSVAAGANHTLFIKTDGTLWGVGWNLHGAVGPTTSTLGAFLVTPVQLATGVASVSGGFYHTMFLKTDGTLWGLGGNAGSQLGDGTATDRLAPVQVASGVTAVSSGAYFTMFRKTDGTLWAVGENLWGQFGDGTATSRSTPVQVATGVASVSAGGDYTAFVKTDGTLWATGANDSGQLGDGTSTSRRTPVQVATAVASVSALTAHLMFVKTNATMWAAGYNGDGRLGDGTVSDRRTPIQVAADVSFAAAGENGPHTLYVKTDGSLWAMGSNFYGQLGDGSNTNRSTPVMISGPGGPVTNAAPTDITLSPGTVAQSAGANAAVGTLSTTDADSTSFTYTLVSGTGATDNASFSIAGSTLRANLPATLAAGSFSVRIQSADSSGNTFAKAFAITVTAAPATVSGATAFTAGALMSAYVKSDGTLMTVGDNRSGQLGDGTTANRSTPVQVATGVASVSAGISNYMMFVKTDATLWGTGENIGNLGDGSATNRLSPVQVATGVATVAAGSLFTLFVKTNGTLWATGFNQYGQLCDGTLSTRTIPVQVATGVSSVAAGDSHTAFVKTDGTLWTAGFNAYGQLGDGSTTFNRITPQPVATGVASAAAGYGHTVFVKTDGTLWAMGWNGSGQLGDGTTANRFVPVQVATGVASVTAGAYHTVFVKTDGTLWGMGSNVSGALGDGTTTQRGSPVPIATGVAAVSAGYYHTVFKKTDGTLWGMGANARGQLADGTNTNRLTPVPLLGAPAAATNDSFAVATTLSGTTGQLTGTLVGATRDATDPSIFGLTLSSSVWYRWTAVSSGSVTFRLSNASFQSYIGAYSGTAGDFVLLSNNTVSGSVTFNANAGTTYAILVDRYGGTAGGFSLGWEQMVAAPAMAYLSNLSVLARAGTQSETLIAGVTIGSGGGSKTLLVRGIGPALGGFGLNNALADPIMTISRGSTRISINDDWDNNSGIAATSTSLGAFALAPASKDAAILGTGFSAGGYSIALEGKNGATGTGLIELYDADPSATITATSARLTNISARTFGGTGAETLIIGFTVRGTGTLRVLVRASGPALSAFGLVGLMPDPKLELYSGAGVKLTENDNWDASTLTAQNSVGAFAFPANSKDAVLVSTLSPGGYTAQVVPAGGATGVALVEIYVLP